MIIKLKFSAPLYGPVNTKLAKMRSFVNYLESINYRYFSKNNFLAVITIQATECVKPRVVSLYKIDIVTLVGTCEVQVYLTVETY